MVKVKHPETEKVKRVKRAKAEVEDEGGIAILLLGAATIGFWAWLRSQREKAILATKQSQFQQRAVKLSPAPARKVEKQVSQWWNPAYSWHWRGA